jgi:hypothetical protein
VKYLNNRLEADHGATEFLNQRHLLQDEVQLCENFSAKTGRRNSTPDNRKEV